MLAFLHLCILARVSFPVWWLLTPSVWWWHFCIQHSPLSWILDFVYPTGHLTHSLGFLSGISDSVCSRQSSWSWVNHDSMHWPEDSQVAQWNDAVGLDMSVELIMPICFLRKCQSKMMMEKNIFGTNGVRAAAYPYRKERTLILHSYYSQKSWTFHPNPCLPQAFSLKWKKFDPSNSSSQKPWVGAWILSLFPHVHPVVGHSRLTFIAVSSIAWSPLLFTPEHLFLSKNPEKLVLHKWGKTILLKTTNPHLIQSQKKFFVWPYLTCPSSLQQGVVNTGCRSTFISLLYLSIQDTIHLRQCLKHFGHPVNTDQMTECIGIQVPRLVVMMVPISWCQSWI